MAKRNQTPPAETPQPETPPAATPPPRRARANSDLQPELAVQVETLKKQISTLKSLNKTIKVLDGMDRDGLEQVSAWLTKKLAAE